MQRRTFIKRLLAIGLMTPSLNASAINLITDKPEGIATEFAENIESDITDYGQNAVIKVIGVGGGGCNALNFMIDQKVRGVEFISIDSDAWPPKNIKAAQYLQIDVTEISCEAGREQISRLIDDAHMVFIVAGMGGETGIAAAAIVAKISREMNILTIAVVTSPSVAEENHCTFEVIMALRENVDSLISVPIEDLMKIHGVSMQDAFMIANGVMKDAVAGIAEMVNMPGLIGVDFADVRMVMSEKGSAMVGVGSGVGPERARFAADSAIASPLFEKINLSRALGVLITITSTSYLKVKEMEEVMACIQFASEDASIVVGAIYDETMGDELHVTVVATGLGLPEIVYSERRTVNLASLAEFNEVEASGNGVYDIPSFLRNKSICTLARL